MNRGSSQRGFVLLSALAVLAVVGVAMLTLAAASAYDGQRSFDRARRAQLDQMLLAAASDAREHLKKSSPKAGETWEIELPGALSEQNGSLNVTVDAIAENGEAVLMIHATIANRSAQETLRFANTNGQWKLASAEVPL